MDLKRILLRSLILMDHLSQHCQRTRLLWVPIRVLLNAEPPRRLRTLNPDITLVVPLGSGLGLRLSMGLVQELG